MAWLRFLLLLVILYAAWHQWGDRLVRRLPGVTAPSDPLQTTPIDSKTRDFGKHKLAILADFSLEARVLSKKTYSLDNEAEISPIDLALGWGPMSDTAVLDKLSISQSNRSYDYRWQNEPPISPLEIMSHSANMHIIPASSQIEKQILAVRQGQIVSIRGHLIEATRADGWRWRSSLTRDDSGAGACEVILVEAFTIR